MSSKESPRDLAVIAGCIREHAESLKVKLPDSHSAGRLVELCDELDAVVRTRPAKVPLGQLQIAER